MWGIDERYYPLTEKEALEKATSVLDELLEKGKSGEKNLSVTDSKISALTERLNRYGKTIEDAVEHYIQYLGNKAITDIVPLISQLSERWKIGKINSKIKPISIRTKNEVKSYSRWISRTFGTLRPSEVTYNLCVEELDELDVRNVSRRQYNRYLKNFFNWCEKHKFISENPTKGILVTIASEEIHIYQPEKIKSILDLAQTDEFKPLLGFYILATFLGLRPTEAERVQWEDINFNTKEIYVRKGKTPARRFRMNPTAILWLEFFKAMSPTELNPKKAHSNLQKTFRKKIPAWIPDGLRHSFGTYHYNQCRNIAETVFEMGNSIAVARKHYCREIEQEKVTAFWALNPNTN